MELTLVTQDPGVLRILVLGEVDLATSHLLHEAALQALVLPNVDEVVFDLSGVPFLDASGVAALMHAYLELAEQGRQVSVAGAAGMVAAVLHITRADHKLIPAPTSPR
ncbi:hypothetical protein GCM10009682_44900 [Luedemannella flava]|uniref:STAS domain-containing protein n=1 Tax=Luedemannella flava TaxID=349316 RepID=A0ABP4YPA0_9ACTN